MTRIVVVLCGPPGAGKTTIARRSGLAVYDRDDPYWGGSEQAFRAAIAELRTDPHAQAVVIRAGATSSARAKAAALVGATHTYLVMEDERECKRRVEARARDDHIQGRSAVATWFTRHDLDDGVELFKAWRLVPIGPPLGALSEEP